MKIKHLIIALFLLIQSNVFAQKQGDLMISLGMSFWEFTDKDEEPPLMQSPVFMTTLNSFATPSGEPGWMLYFDYMLTDNLMFNLHVLPSLIPLVGPFLPDLTVAVDIDINIFGLVDYLTVVMFPLGNFYTPVTRKDNPNLKGVHKKTNNQPLDMPLAIWVTYLSGTPKSKFRIGPGIGLSYPVGLIPGPRRLVFPTKGLKFTEDPDDNIIIRSIGVNGKDHDIDLAFNLVAFVNLSDKLFLDFRVSYFPLELNIVNHFVIPIGTLVGSVIDTPAFRELVVINLDTPIYIRVEPKVSVNPVVFYAGIGYNFGNQPKKLYNLLENTFRSKRRRM